jgi:hypothetical protein
LRFDIRQSAIENRKSEIGMARTVKHFSLHRIGGTELRVVADVEVGVLPVIQAEEAVIRRYAQQEVWSHRWVTLFILEDLQPLVRQLRPFEIRDSRFEIPMGGAAALNHRPVVNVYDLADPSTELRAGPAGCHVFVNRQAVAKEGYWDDPLAIRGLLAHEHAHPLVENETIRTSRQLRFAISDFGFQIEIENRKSKIRNLLTLLADKLCLYAPREIFANEMTIRSGFAEALFHLDRRTMANASRGVAGREDLRQQLQGEVVSGNLTPQGAALLLLIGDLKGYLDLALEVAPFYRAGRESEARELEAALEAEVFPRLEPEVPRAYIALRDQYIALHADLTPTELMAWSEGVLRILAEALAEKGLEITYRLSQMTNRRET